MRDWNISSNHRATPRYCLAKPCIHFQSRQCNHLTVQWHTLTKLSTATKNLVPGSEDQFGTENAVGDWTYPTGFPCSRNLNHNISAKNAPHLVGKGWLFVEQFIQTFLRPGQDLAWLARNNISSCPFTRKKTHFTNELSWFIASDDCAT